MSEKESKKGKKKPKQIKTGIGHVLYNPDKIENNQGPGTSTIHPTISVGRKSYERASGLGAIRAGLMKPGMPSTKKDSTYDIKRFTPYKGHYVDNIFAGRFNKNGKDIHAHTFAISHSKANNHHFQETRIRHHRNNVYQPSITMDDYNNKVINSEPNNDYDNQLYIVNQPINIEKLAQGPLA